jgi:hypothetical protein
MYDDIRAWYFVLELVKSKKSQKDPLLGFAAENGLTMEAAEETFQRASRFILNNMTLNREGIKWESRPITKFIRGYGPQVPEAPVSLQCCLEPYLILLEKWEATKTSRLHCYVEHGSLKGRGFIRRSSDCQRARQTKARSGIIMEIHATGG